MSDSREHMTIRRRGDKYCGLRKLQLQNIAALYFLIMAIFMPLISVAGTEITTVTVGLGPRYIAVNLETNKVYVVNNYDNTVTVLNGKTNTPVKVVAVGYNPSAIAIDTPANKIYVSNIENMGNGTVTIIDGETDTVSATVTVGFSPKALAVNPNTHLVYVVNSISGTITVINPADVNNPSNLAVGNFPVAVALDTSANNKVYVVHSGLDGIVTVIDAANDNKMSKVSVGPYPIAVAVNTVTHKVYVLNFNEIGTVTVINSVAPINSVGVGPFPYAIAVNEFTGQIYVVNQGVTKNGIPGTSTVSVIDGSTDTVSGPLITVGVEGSYAVVVNQVTNKIYVANRTSDSVTMIDGNTNIPTAFTDPNGLAWDAPTALAINSETNRVYVANEYSRNVGILQNFYVITIIKVGMGTVTSAGESIICGATCSAVFPEGPEVLLFQTPDASYGFNGWGGKCSGTGDCAFSVLSDTSVTADFIQSPLVKNQKTGVAYTSLQSAYNEANGGDTISSLTVLPAEGLTLNTDISITLDGGYDASYSSCTGMTPVLGRVNVRLAPLHVRGLAIKATPL